MRLTVDDHPRSSDLRPRLSHAVPSELNSATLKLASERSGLGRFIKPIDFKFNESKVEETTYPPTRGPGGYFPPIAMTFNLGAMLQSNRDLMKKLTIALVATPVVASVIVAIFLISQFQNELLVAFLILSFIYFAASFLLIFLPYFLTLLKDVGRERTATKMPGAKSETDGVKTESKPPE